jgi:hypothetical protein
MQLRKSLFIWILCLLTTILMCPGVAALENSPQQKEIHTTVDFSDNTWAVHRRITEPPEPKNPIPREPRTKAQGLQ